MSTVIGQTFTVFVDDNFHYMEEDERWVAGEFSSYDDAIAECKRIVELSLQDGLSQKGPMTAEELYSYYTDFGDDPFVRPGPTDDTRFSAWGYAKERCAILCPSTPTVE
ncbi:MAG: hypothetical protein C0508_00215 [Cyanobacteria bacterium PR.023]|nr:hypothetical protein [Cyanobacteria bacterium PR.023]